jgi:DNA-binding IclR family transcriptional regulator
MPTQYEARGRADRKAAGQSNSVRRALSILGLLNQSAHPLSFSDIKAALDLPKSTTSFLLSTLETLGYVTRDRENRRYWLNPQAYRAGSIPMTRHDLTEIAAPVLKSVSGTISLTSFISVLDGDQVLFLEKADGPYPSSCDVYAGRKANAQCTTVGKVLLAWMDKEEQQKFLDRHHVIPHTNRTITSKSALMEELKRVREAGYAIDDQEEALWIRCVAVPVISEDSPGTVALGITGSVTEIRPDNIASLIRYLKQMAQRIKSTGEAPFGRGAAQEFARNFTSPRYQ